MNFSENLKMLIDDSGKKIAEIADDLGICQQTLYSYLAGKTTAEYEYLILLADYFNCSVDYLAGREYEKEPAFKECPPFSQRLDELIKEKKCSKNNLSKKTKISRSLIRAWASGKNKPNLNSLTRLSDFFEYSIDFLIGRED